LGATVFMSLLGKTGMRRLAEVNVSRAHHACACLVREAGLSEVFSAPFFNEFVLRSPDAKSLFGKCAREKIIPGISLETWYPELKNCLLVCVTEMNEREEIDRLVRAIGP
jgi:glycine dehydrogenase subunit 1